MITNNIEFDIKMKCLEANVTQQELGESVGTTGQYVNRIIKHKGNIIMNKMYVKIMEKLGYDITLVYTKREK